MKQGLVELGRIVLDMARRLPAQEHYFVGYGPHFEPVAFFSEADGLAGPHHAPSEASLPTDTVIDAPSRTDVSPVAAIC
jgi:hypothetical protein